MEDAAMGTASPVFYIVVYGHAGDNIISRPFIKALVTRYPDVKVVVECVKLFIYLWADLGVELVTVERDETELLSGHLVKRVFEPGIFCFHLYITSIEDKGYGYVYGYSYRMMIHRYNAFLKAHGLYSRYHLCDKRDTPFNEFPPQPHVPHARAGGILVENGPVFSYQSCFDLNGALREFAEMFPGLNFYCADKPAFEADNVFDVSAYNLVELSELSNSCLAFLTRCSGVNAASTTETNKYKPRCCVGINDHLVDSWGWQVEENPIIFAEDKPAVIAFLNYVNDNREVLPIHIKRMGMNPHAYRAQLKDYVEETSFCKFLTSKEEVSGCVDYLKLRSCGSNKDDYKNWETAHILSDLSDGNYLDFGNCNATLILNIMRKGIPGEKYVACSADLPDAQKVPAMSYVTDGTRAFADGFFNNITCLSASEQEIDLTTFIPEASRLLCGGGKLYITFDYGETKTPGQAIFDKTDVLALIETCKANGLALTEPMNWQLGDMLGDVQYTIGILRFGKKEAR